MSENSEIVWGTPSSSTSRSCDGKIANEVALAVEHPNGHLNDGRLRAKRRRLRLYADRNRERQSDEDSFVHIPRPVYTGRKTGGREIRRISVGVMCASATLALLHAQGPSTVFRSASDLVIVPATVTDRTGRFVRGLSAADFSIFEDDARRPTAQFSAERVPVSVAIVLDVSGSMSTEPRRWDLTRRSVASFLSRLEKDDEVTLVAFNARPQRLGGWTRHTFDVFTELGRASIGGTTALFRALLAADSSIRRCGACAESAASDLGRERPRHGHHKSFANIVAHSGHRRYPPIGRHALRDRHRPGPRARRSAERWATWRNQLVDTSKW